MVGHRDRNRAHASSKKMYQMGEMGEAALENGWPFFTSQRCDEVAEKNCVKKVRNG